MSTFSSVAIAVVGLAGGAACNTPTPSLQLLLAGPPTQACPSVDCASVTMRCPTVMSIKIMDPRSPDSPYVSQCVQISPNRKQDMCAIASVDLDPAPIPVRDLEVQIALYPASMIQTDPNNGTLVCPSHVSYASATGFPIEQAPTPALGGNAYYHPGDGAVVVTLGCTDLSAINDSCAAELVSVVATVESFETGLLVGNTATVVDQLAVSVGEPRSLGDRDVLETSDTHPLRWQAGRDSSQWTDNLPEVFTKYSCVEVLETVAQSTATVTCKLATTSPIELRGEWVQKSQVDEILGALQLREFPAEGLTIGVVVDEIGNPVPGAVVSAKQGQVTYLSTDRTSLVKDATSPVGIFVSTSAPFGTEFSTTAGPGKPVLTGIGGRIAGRVTTVVLQPNASRR